LALTTVLRGLTLPLSIVKESVFCLRESPFDCFPWVVWEIWMLDYKLMQLVPEVVSTGRPTVTVIHSKERASWPIWGIFEFGLDDIKDYRNTIFIVISDYTLMCIRCIGGNDTISLASIFCRLICLNKLDYGWVKLVLDPS
jgi:hypothetical protein